MKSPNSKPRPVCPKCGGKFFRRQEDCLECIQCGRCLTHPPHTVPPDDPATPLPMPPPANEEEATIQGKLI